MNPFEMVIGIVLIVSIANVLKARYGVGKGKGGNEHHPDAARDDAESRRLRDEIRSLRERIQVLERVITDNETDASRLDREIEQLRDKNRV
ncbi:hypothetical protein TPR58_21355 [Sphingomonas sp. HF-S3]|uniref:Phage shock protein B n=1 Tax=Sphingomonas rustica TaxID=3103142 RepID=A0ABV0BDV5_9SPHN